MKDWQRIEAVLFGSGKYLTEEQIIELSGVPKNKIKKALNELQKHYDSIETSLKVFHESDTWKLNIKEEYNDIMKNIVSEAEMPKPIMETLAVIAYKAPVLQSDVIEARGSGAYEHIGLLEEKGFVEKEKYGRTYKLRLGEKFYDYFDIEGPSEIKKVFGEAKKPEIIGNLEVYEADEKDDNFAEKITERLQKLEKTEEETQENKDFLEKFEEKITNSRNRIDETEKEMSEFKREEKPETESTDSEEQEENFDEQYEENSEEDEKEPIKKEKREMTTEEVLKKVEEDIDEITHDTDETDKDI